MEFICCPANLSIAENLSRREPDREHKQASQTHVWVAGLLRVEAVTATAPPSAAARIPDFQPFSGCPREGEKGGKFQPLFSLSKGSLWRLKKTYSQNRHEGHMGG